MRIPSISRASAWRWVTWAAVAGERVGQATVQAARVRHATLLALCALALALALCACGSIHRVPDADARADALASARPVHTPVRLCTSVTKPVTSWIDTSSVPTCRPCSTSSRRAGATT